MKQVAVNKKKLKKLYLESYKTNLNALMNWMETFRSE